MHNYAQTSASMNYRPEMGCPQEFSKIQTRIQDSLLSNNIFKNTFLI